MKNKTVTIPAEDYKLLVKVAEKHMRSKSNMVAVLIRQAFEKLPK